MDKSLKDLKEQIKHMPDCSDDETYVDFESMFPMDFESLKDTICDLIDYTAKIESRVNTTERHIQEVKDIGEELESDPKRMEIFRLVHVLRDDKDLGFVLDLTKRLVAKEEEEEKAEVIGMLAERIAHLQNVIDDLIFTNRLELTIDHSDDTLKNKEKIENFKEDVKKWNEENQN